MYSKKQFIFAIMAFILVSCSRTDDTTIPYPESRLIDFSAYSSLVNSRALDKSSFAIGDEIRVSAFHHSGSLVNDVTEKAQVFKDNFFKNLQVKAIESTVNPTSVLWTYENQRYWPVNSDEYLSFVATNSETPRDLTVNTEGQISIDNFVVGTDASKQEDLLWSGVPNRVSNSGVVTFTFNHSLSRIIFVATAVAKYDNSIITINSITIGDIVNNGSYVFGNLAKNMTSWALGSWSLPMVETTKDRSDYTPLVAGNDPLVVGTTSQNVGESLLLIPQTVTGKKITIKYSIKDIKLGTIVQQKDVIIRPKNNWNQNTQYTYNLKFELNPINFGTIVIDEWEEEIVPEQNVPNSVAFYSAK